MMREATPAKKLLDQTRDEPFFEDCVEHCVRHLLAGIKDEQNVSAGSVTLPTYLRECF
jgi:hypothetical protein